MAFIPYFFRGSKARQDKMPSRIPESAPVTFQFFLRKRQNPICRLDCVLAIFIIELIQAKKKQG